MVSRSNWSIALIGLVLVAACGLGGCGRKGDLDLPSASATPPPAAPAEPGAWGQQPPPQPAPAAPAPSGNRTFVLDPLLN